MKKIISFLTAVILLMSNVAFAEYMTIYSADGMFGYTEDGTVSFYFGGEVVTIPSEIDGIEITAIGEQMCFDLGISTIYIEEGIRKIHKSAFEGSSVEYVDIPASMEMIDERAFANCENLSWVVLNSDETNFGEDTFAGTGYIEFTVPCTADTESLRKKIMIAKGDSNFDFFEMHTALTESMVEKDIYGENVFYCEACGFKASKYVEDITLPFSDVPTDAWYYSYVQTAYDFGVLSGKSETIFDPDAGLTCAEAAKIAAVIHNLNRSDGKVIEFQQTGDNWYDVYVDYCYKNEIIEDYIIFEWNKSATRGEMAYMFSRCDTSDYYLNDVPITDIPDVYDTTPYAYEILDLYNKGIAVGSDEYMAYYPDSQVKRSEAAALISRILRLDMRIELPKG